MDGNCKVCELEVEFKKFSPVRGDLIMLKPEPLGPQYRQGVMQHLMRLSVLFPGVQFVLLEDMIDFDHYTEPDLARIGLQRIPEPCPTTKPILCSPDQPSE